MLAGIIKGDVYVCVCKCMYHNMYNQFDYQK